MRVPESEIKTAYDNADPKFLEIIAAAAANIRKFHEAQRQNSWFIEDGDGVVLGKRVLPLDRVALLIPGASAPLFSTLLMAAIPAQIAGVPQICIATPPPGKWRGSPHRTRNGPQPGDTRNLQSLRRAGRGRTRLWHPNHTPG